MFCEKPCPISIPRFRSPCLILVCISSRQFVEVRISIENPSKLFRAFVDMSV
jgi:hypothetical protein